MAIFREDHAQSPGSINVCKAIDTNEPLSERGGFVDTWGDTTQRLETPRRNATKLWAAAVTRPANSSCWYEPF